MMGMFPRIKTFLMLVILTTIVFSATLMTHPVFSPAAAKDNNILLSQNGDLKAQDLVSSDNH
jgi:hypothetical protein